MPPNGYDDRPDYRVDILRRRNVVTVTAGDRVIARTERPLLVDEQDHGIVVYVPKDDVDFSQLADHELATICPYKGEATHWCLAGDESRQPMAWTYLAPYPQVAPIADHIAFYQDRVTVSVGVATPAVVGSST